MMKFEDKEYIEAFTPRHNGCLFLLIIKNNGTASYTAGCLIPALVPEINSYLWKKVSKNNGEPVDFDISPKLKTELMKITPCNCCGGTFIEEERVTTREYKGLAIPNRKPRNNTDIKEKMASYCKKSDCRDFSGCVPCLFDYGNIKKFTEWYLLKNKLGGGWISVKESLPEVGAPVLMRVMVTDHINVEEGSYRGDDTWVNCWRSTKMTSSSVLGVTHWMPLPAEPDSVKQKG